MLKPKVVVTGADVGTDAKREARRAYLRALLAYESLRDAGQPAPVLLAAKRHVDGLWEAVLKA